MHLRLVSGQLLETGYTCVSAAHVPADRLAGPVLGKPQSLLVSCIMHRIGAWLDHQGFQSDPVEAFRKIDYPAWMG